MSEDMQIQWSAVLCIAVTLLDVEHSFCNYEGMFINSSNTISFWCMHLFSSIMDEFVYADISKNEKLMS